MLICCYYCNFFRHENILILNKILYTFQNNVKSNDTDGGISQRVLCFQVPTRLIIETQNTIYHHLSEKNNYLITIIKTPNSGFKLKTNNCVDLLLDLSYCLVVICSF